MTPISTCHRCDKRQQKCYGACPCTVDGRDIIEHAIANDCPLGRFDPSYVPPPIKAATVQVGIMRVKGPIIWRAMHTHAAKIAPEELPGEPARLAKLDLPCGDCKQGWLKILKEMPPDLSSTAAYFAWTWAAHQIVNKKLGRPGITLEESRKIYGA